MTMNEDDDGERDDDDRSDADRYQHGQLVFWEHWGLHCSWVGKAVVRIRGVDARGQLAEVCFTLAGWQRSDEGAVHTKTFL